jgi:hypothetical protein
LTKTGVTLRTPVPGILSAIGIFRQSVGCAHVFLDTPYKPAHNLAHQFSGESEPALNISALSKRPSTLLG